MIALVASIGGFVANLGHATALHAGSPAVVRPEAASLHFNMTIET